MTRGSAEPGVTPAFTMLGSDTAAACEGDACVVGGVSDDPQDAPAN